VNSSYPASPALPQAYVVVSDRCDFVVTPMGPGLYEDSSCVEDLCQPAVFKSQSQAEAIARAMCVDSGGFSSQWRVKALPPGCDTRGLAVLLLTEFADEAARVRDVFGLDVSTTFA